MRKLKFSLFFVLAFSALFGVGVSVYADCCDASYTDSNGYRCTRSSHSTVNGVHISNYTCVKQGGGGDVPIEEPAQ